MKLALPLILLPPLNILVMAEPNCIPRIKSAARRDNIDLSVLPFLDAALQGIASLAYTRVSSELPFFSNANRIDTHTHPVPSWFRDLQPLSAGRETPAWDPVSHLAFMAEHAIGRSILCMSTPQANAFPGEKEKTVALARLLNEFVAELVRVWPEFFSWMAVTPLPYVDEAIQEVKYAIEELGAVGVGVLTNHEGLYPGEGEFDPLWEYLQGRAEKGDGREIVFVHPHDPVIRLEDGRLVSSKPCECSCFIVSMVKSLTNNGKHLFVRGWANFTLRPRERFRASRRIGRSSGIRMFTGEYHTEQAHSLTSPIAFYLAFLKMRKRRARYMRRASGTTVRALCIPGK